MVYVPWANYGICKYWMLKRCYSGFDCKWKHPEPAERKRIWDEETRRQEDDERLGIPRPQPRSKKELDRGVSSLDAPPSPKDSPKKHKGVNKTQPIGNANREALGKPNRLTKHDDTDSFMQDGTWACPTNKRDGLNIGQNEVEQQLSSDVPSPFATTHWKRSDAPADSPMGDTEGSPRQRTGYWERLKARKAGEEKNKEPNGHLDGVAEDRAPRPEFPRGEIRELQTSTSIPSPRPALPNTATSAANMGATKRLSNGEAKHVGPHPSTIRVSAQYTSQNAIEKKLRAPNSQAQFDLQERSLAEAREDTMRLQGCTWIDNVRRALQLPIRTYTTACVYYHKLRLAHPGILNGMEYGNSWSDACAASLLTSCKTEDTLKKSRDVLAAAYNLKANTHDQVGSDDPMFDASSRAVIGLERLVLESGGFDFRSKYPHKLLMKLLKTVPEGVDGERENVAKIAWSALTDLYRTFAPLKQTAATMALASLELAAHLVASSSPNNVSSIRDHLQQYDIGALSTSREEIMETLLDALDMYTQHAANTILGVKYSLDDFLRIRLAFNKECNEKNLPRYTAVHVTDRAVNGATLRVANGHPTPVSPPQPGAQTQQPSGTQQTPEGGGTLRFVLDPQLAAEEKSEVQKYFVEEWEDYEEEIEIPITRPADDPPKDNGRSERSDRETMRPKDSHASPRDRPQDRDRDAERDRNRVRERERERDRDRDRRFDDRRFDNRFDDRDRRYDDRRGHRYEDRRYEDDRRRRDDRR